ncbi:similar to Saccharomyces cerevisiae YFR019W FAB1 1-phosphatidylinositol-3-phosphate 5-kinase [Maudiozyma saulgeensis]|uniref:1-phosphatidylinositol-3-phosphate 5-kinase n=1 Tax=Maudiozyma saulgeensis TaxID=1789683 RepID=A0A1X7R1X3_9SACH|nr:similar to Saccharomyces cerevisiae YFR019W FAB1 1-phosphatidylinositol-3-phosphate 5-kinase [Kazachstania saulgeensis]
MSNENISKDENSIHSNMGSNNQFNTLTSIDKPEFLGRPIPMPLKSTTNIDINPVLSNITVPNKIFLDNTSQKSSVAPTATTTATATTATTATSTVQSQIDNPIDLRKIRADDNISVPNKKNNNAGSIPIPKTFSPAVAARIPSIKDSSTTLSREQQQQQNKNTSLTFTLNNEKKLKRSSTYASKSTVKAIPIASNKKNNTLNYSLNDAESSISRSSSMTTSLSRSFLFGFYNDNKKSKQTTKNVLSKEYWMKDESSKECFTCGKPFNTFRRKHHCRICGQIFCSSCTLQIPAEKFGFSGNMRVCSNCFEQANNYEDSSDEDEDNIVDVSGQVIDHPHSLLKNDIDNDYNNNNNNISRSMTSINEEYYDSQNPSELSTNGKQNEILLLNNDDVQSIMTSGEDSKLFVSTPPPPPKMAIPATRQGESLEISFKDNTGRNKKIISPNNNVNHGLPSVMKMVSPSNHNSYNRDPHSLRDISLLRTPSSSPFKSGNFSNKGETNYHQPYHVRNKPSATRLGRSIFNYVTSATSAPFDERSETTLHDNQQRQATDHAKNIIENLTNKNFKFKFNYGQKSNDNKELEQTVSDSDSQKTQTKLTPDETREDEGTMSIYSSLNGAVHSDNPIRSTRNSTRSFQRAEASLQRMRSRRKSKSKTGTVNIYRDINLLTHSTPNLLSVVSDNDTSEFAIGKFPDDSSVVNEDNNSQSFDTIEGTDFNSKTNMNLSGSQNSKPQTTPNSLSNSMIISSKHNSGKSNTFNQWKRLSSMSGLRYHQGNKNVLNEVATLHFKELLIQVLNDQDITNTDKWLNILEDMALANIQNITLSARDSNTLDYRQKYVKIKRITGGSITDSEYIDGIVFAKALPMKGMPRYVDNPRILLVMFPLEYQRNENQFLSIESVFSQEKEYLNKLISRITSLNPDIIFAGANVSGYALQLLHDAGIVVQFNIKPQVIERIARLTEADIAISIDKLASNVKMGECASFEIKTYIYGNISRTYTFLRGCNSSLGGTILLRGDNADNLRKIKHVVEFMVYVEFSLKLESSFFNDNFIQLSTNFYLQQKIEKETMVCSGYFSDFLQKLNKRILTVSPTVEFPIPFLLKRARDIEANIDHKLLEYDKLNDDSTTNDANQLTDLDIKSTLTLTDVKHISKFIMEREINDLKLQFQRKSRQWEVSYSLSSNLLGTGSHQSITVLYSMVSTKTATPCIDPQLVTIDYFWDTDISIGQFIENVVSTAWYPCDGGCNGLLFDHYRSYVHGSGKVDVLIEKFQTKLPKLKNVILTWSYCKKCGTSTPILQLSEKTWNYSFGKYLEVMFWSKKGSLSDIGKCEHDFTKDHVKYFGYNDLVVRMEYSDLEIYELLTPPPKINWKPKVDIKMKVELYYQILDKINMFYESVTNRLDRIKLDSLSEEKIQSGEEIILSLKEKSETEKKTLFDNLETIYRGTSGDSHLKLNSIVKELYDNALAWDSEFSSFGKTFLPSETDISRITTNQLKKFFSDENNDRKNSISSLGSSKFKEPKSIIDATSEQKYNEEKAVEEPTKTASTEEIPNLKPDINSFSEIDTSPGEIKTIDNQPIPLLHKTHIPSPLIDSNINKDGRSYSNSSKSNNVTKLANFFDQMHLDAISKEFDLQRELQRRKLNMTKYQGLKPQSISPIVEIYKDVNDAVDEPLHDINKDNHVDSLFSYKKGAQLGDRSSPTQQLNQNLENELENSITQWGQHFLKKDDVTKPKDGDLVIEFADKVTDSNTPEPLPPVTTPTVAVKDDSTPAPEKNLLMKALTNFWADRSPSLWNPLLYPTSPTEHVFSDNTVIIREDEPSSLIAFCLNTTDYRTKINKMETQHKQKVSGDGTLDEVQTNHTNDEQVSETHKVEASDKESTSRMIETGSTTTVTGEHNTNGNTATPSVNQPVDNEFNTLESFMTKKTAVHLRYQFEDELTVMSCKIFFTEHFDAFRRICNCGDNFIQSLSRCVKWDSSGGKSGSGFLKTLDDRFVIKELSHSELDAFIKFAPSYFEYMAQAMFHDLPTSLAKVFGFYQIQVKNSLSGSKSYKMDVIIMENLFYEKKTSRIFDLKGSMRNRHVEQTGKENEVLLDENMVEYIYESPIHVREYDKKLLRASLWNDTLFLAKMNVMDYSLVVGIDNDNYTLVVGIIDFIRTFTWDKKLESWVKEKGLVGGGSSSIIKQPTVVTPRQYKNRFREAMERYILMVPDPWFQETN